MALAHFEWILPAVPIQQLQLLAGEVAVLSQQGVAIYDGDVQSQWQAGKLLLTSHRLIYESTPPGDLLCLPLGKIASATRSMGFGSWSHSKITARLPDGSHCKFSFRSGGAAEFHAALLDMLQRRLWCAAAAAAAVGERGGSVAAGAPANSKEKQRHQQQAEEEEAAAAAAEGGGRLFSPGAAGIQGLLLERGAAARTAQRSLDEALRDIDSLMANVGAIADAVARLRRPGGGGRDASASDEALILSIEESLGLGATVTAARVGRGAQLHEEIAGELAAWLAHPANPLRAHVVLPLVELFAQYNRARGEALLSPEDVLRACEVMVARRGAAFQLKRFRSGVVALQRVGVSLEAVVARLIGPRLSDGPPADPTHLCLVTDAELALALAVSPAVARDVLLDMEEDEVLCRDERAHGAVAFAWNVFCCPPMAAA